MVALIVAGACAAARADDAKVGLTFFGWADQHVTVKGEAEHLVPAIDAMNALPGAAFPAAIGGTVARPAFVFGAGDITEWPTHAAMRKYDKLITGRLKWPAYDILGNHDEGGKVPSRTMVKWLTGRHGGLSYTFEKGGVHFVAVHSKYDPGADTPAQPISAEALKFIRQDLKKVPRGRPVIVAMHLCYEAITNRGALLDALAGGNVILVLGGHYHKASVNIAGGIPFVQLPSPTKKFPNQVTVIRITPDRLVAVPYDYDKKAWVTDKRKMLDMAMPKAGAKPPVAKPVAAPAERPAALKPTARFWGPKVVAVTFGHDFNVGPGAKPASYTIAPAGGKGVRPVKVGRDSKVRALVKRGWPYKPVMQHTVFLVLPEAVRPGKFVLSVDAAVTARAASIEVSRDPSAAATELIKINQCGYLPAARRKLAYLGGWMGELGALGVAAHRVQLDHLRDVIDGKADALP